MVDYKKLFDAACNNGQDQTATYSGSVTSFKSYMDTTFSKALTDFAACNTALKTLNSAVDDKKACVYSKTKGINATAASGDGCDYPTAATDGAFISLKAMENDNSGISADSANLLQAYTLSSYFGYNATAALKTSGVETDAANLAKLDVYDMNAQNNAAFSGDALKNVDLGNALNADVTNFVTCFGLVNATVLNDIA
jgi:hypothetical protein